MKTDLIKITNEIEARNDATRCLINEALRTGDLDKIDTVTTPINIQQKRIADFERSWSSYVAPQYSMDHSADEQNARQEMPDQLRLIRDTAREIESLITAILEGSSEFEQFMNSAYTIANSQADYIRELRDLIGDLS